MECKEHRVLAAWCPESVGSGEHRETRAQGLWDSWAPGCRRLQARGGTQGPRQVVSRLPACPGRAQPGPPHFLARPLRVAVAGGWHCPAAGAGCRVPHVHAHVLAVELMALTSFLESDICLQPFLLTVIHQALATEERGDGYWDLRSLIRPPY